MSSPPPPPPPASTSGCSKLGESSKKTEWEMQRVVIKCSFGSLQHQVLRIPSHAHSPASVTELAKGRKIPKPKYRNLEEGNTQSFLTVVLLVCSYEGHDIQWTPLMEHLGCSTILCYINHMSLICIKTTLSKSGLGLKVLGTICRWSRW